MRLIVPSSGTYYHIETLEAPRYARHFDLVTTPEELDTVGLSPEDVLLIPCRTPAQRMIVQTAPVGAHLHQGGTVVAMGESRSELWLDHVRFTPRPTNWWWWLTPGADLGNRIDAPDHPLMRGLGKPEITWHLHGWFAPPAGATVLASNAEGRAILYLDEVSTAGRMIVTSLDPIYHHGSHFMPATTRFLDAFLPALRDWAST